MFHDDVYTSLERDDDTDVADLAETRIELPRRFAVVFYNDDYTPMDFVIEILQKHFHLSIEKAVEIMLNVHYDGRGVAGVYSKDIAETKSYHVNQEAQKAGYPLFTKAEPE